MTGDGGTNVTQLLRAVGEGDPSAAAELLPLLYEELRTLAAARMRKLPVGQTLQPTALVHEAYLRLLGGADPGWENLGHFFFAAARAMHDILVEQARRKMSRKRGGGRQRVEAENLVIAVQVPPDDLVSLSEALDKLRGEDDRGYRLVMLRFFAGLPLADAAEALGISIATAKRDWSYVRARLHRELTEPLSRAFGVRN
jgi:RNA polymerase sigma factor (TIGR02999 family)